MRKISRFQAALAFILTLSLFGLSAFAQEVPDDATPVVEPGDERGEKLVDGVEQDNPTARLEWQRQAWGVVTPSFRTTAMAEGKKHSNRKNSPGPKWVSIGPNGSNFDQNGSFTGHVRDSGRARTILPHPTEPEIVYFLTSGGGLWRTKNWSSPQTEWTPLTDDLPTTGGGSVAFGKNPNTLYLGLGDPHDQILVGGSMVKSRNGGNSWEPMIELGNALSVRDVKVDTSTNRDIVLVGTNNGLYRSADDGATYQALAPFTGRAVWSIQRTSAGWLASSQPCPTQNNGVQCGSATTLYLSTDRGATWAPISNAGNVFAGSRTTLAVAVPGDNVVYAYANTITGTIPPTTNVGPDAALRDVYRSTDGGQTWVANNVNGSKVPLNPVPGMTNMNICHGQCWYNQSIAVDPRDPGRNTLWIGGDLASAASSDGGASWSVKTWWLYSQFPALPYAHADHHAAAFKMTGTPTIILGNDGGLNISTDDGATFSSDKNNGLVSHLYYTISGTPLFPSLVIGGLQDNGTRLRVGNSSIHDQVLGGDGMGTAYSQGNTNTVLASTQGSGLRTNLSNNPPINFQNWAGATAGLSDFGFGFFTAIVPAPGTLDGTGRVFFHFTNTRVWKTINGGLNWTLIGATQASPGVVVTPGLPAGRSFRSSPYNLGVSPQDVNRVGVGAAGGFLDVTTNGGASWTDISLIAKVPGYVGFTTNVTWQDNKNIWVSSVAQAAGSVRVIKGTIANAGDSWSTATWTARQNGLPDLPVTRVYIDPRDAAGNTLYAATHVGIYRTTDGGDNWAPYGNGLPTVRVNDIYMPPDGSSLRIATYGRGIWELVQLELVSTELTDSGSSCDADGILDNGETGSLTVTLTNQGPNNVNAVTLTITSSNPDVTFPNGNVLSFPPVQKGNESTGSIAVALNGATGIETTDFQISINSPELGLPSAFNVSSTHRLNYDEQLQGSATEDVEAASNGWTATGSATTNPNIFPWQRRALTATQHVWWGPDNNGQRDGQKLDGPDEQSLVSPAITVGAGALSVTFKHRHSFDFQVISGILMHWDGGVVEISSNGGTTWSASAATGYNGLTTPTTTAPIGGSRPAFVGRSLTWPSFITSTINFGTAYAGQTVQIRFRVGANQFTGAPGWDVDDITVNGAASTPFTTLVPETGSCSF